MPSLAANKEAAYKYELLETFEAGLILSGAEVKSAKLGQVSLRGAYVSLRQRDKLSRFYLVGAHFSPYKFAGQQANEPVRDRQLLLKKSELSYLIGKSKEKGLTLVPTKLYTKNGLVKLEFALARGKKLYDKRESIKKRDIDRDVKRTLKIKNV